MDAGTAVNYEVVHRDGIYQGGAIGAGPALVQEALRGDTAQLPDVSLSLPEAPVGQSTQTALQSGVVWGLIESVRGMHTRLAQSLPTRPGWSSRADGAASSPTIWATASTTRRTSCCGGRLLTEMNREH